VKRKEGPNLQKFSGVSLNGYWSGVLDRGGVVTARICKGRCSKNVEVGERSWLVGGAWVVGREGNEMTTFAVRWPLWLGARKLCFWLYDWH
jgi:hypothetical protein